MFVAGGIVIASVRMDDANFHCDDSCIYANDGQCDENQAIHLAPNCTTHH